MPVDIPPVAPKVRNARISPASRSSAQHRDINALLSAIPSARLSLRNLSSAGEYAVEHIEDLCPAPSPSEPRLIRPSAAFVP